MRRVARLSAAVAGAFLLCASTAAAQVPGEEIARRAFEDGVALEKKGDCAGALAKFRESEQIKATLGVRYHKAYCLEMTGKLAAALIEYEIVDKTARETNKAELGETTRARLEPLRTRVPQLSLRVAVTKDAEVMLDGAPIAPALLDGKTFRIDPGEHVVTARAPDHEAFAKRFSAGESTTTSIEIVLQKAGAKPAPVAAAPSAARKSEPDPTTEPPAEPGRARSRTLPILTTVGAVVLAAGGVGAFVVAGKKKDDLDVCTTMNDCEDKQSATRTFDTLALGSWIGAAGLAALSVVLWSSSPSSSASAGARVVARSSWLGLEGRF